MFNFATTGELRFCVFTQASWTAKPTAPRFPDIYSAFALFLEEVVLWIHNRVSSPLTIRTQAAIVVIRDSSSPFYGVGVYTAVEIFFKAGKALLLHPLV